MVCFDKTVRQQLVHKQKISEVLIAGARSVSPGRHVLDVRWPDKHAFYRVDDVRHDSLLFAETVRQASIFVGHEFMTIPLGDVFLLRRAQIEKIGRSGPRAGSPTEVTLNVTVHEIGGSAAGAKKYRTIVEFTADQGTFAIGRGEVSVLAPRAYSRLRGDCATSSAPAASSSKSLLTKCGDGEMAAGKGAPTWKVHASAAHPVFFDHPSDHVPGMLILEAVRQAARVYTNMPEADLESFDGRYESFIETTRPLYICLTSAEISYANTHELLFSIVQDERACATVAASVKRPSTSGRSLSAESSSFLALR